MIKSVNLFISSQYQKIKERYLQGHLTKGLFIIGSGIVIAQFITVITTPIITRLYTPTDFGILAVFASTLMIVMIAGGFRYDSALPLPKQDIDAANLFILFLGILSISTIVLCGIFLIFGDFFFSLFHAENLRPYFFLFIIGFFGGCIYRALTYWVTRRRDYIRITHTKINQNLGGAAGKIVLGYLSFGPLGLIIGYILTQCMGITTLLKKMWAKDRHLFNNISRDRMLAMAKEYRQFPFFSFPAAIFNSFTTSSPAIMLASIYGFEVAGYYGLAYSLLILPGSLISQSMSQVYYAEASKMMRENSFELLSVFKSTTKKLFLIGVPLIGIPSLIAPYIFPFIFGDVWRDAGYFCLPLSLSVLGSFVMSSTTNLGGYGFNDWMLAFDFSRMLIILGGFLISSYLSLTAVSALWIFSILMAAMYYVLYLMNIAAIKKIRP